MCTGCDLQIDSVTEANSISIYSLLIKPVEYEFQAGLANTILCEHVCACICMYSVSAMHC